MGIHRNLKTGRLSARKPLALIDPLEPRRLFAATPAGTYPFGGSATASLTDADGTTAKFSLPAGQGAVTVADDGTWHVAISKSTPAASLSLTTTGGDGRASLAELSSSKPLGSINAPKANLSGSISLTNIKSLTLANASNLSITSSTPITSLTASSWTDTDSTPDTFTAPSITSLNIKGTFAPNLTLSSKKVALNSATIGGTLTGTWSVAGSAGTLKLHAVRSPDLSLRGSVTQLTLDDYVAVSQVASATGGVLHFGGKGSVSAAKGKDKFQVAKNITLYTCTADMYTWSELYQFDHLGRKWTMTDNGTKETSRVLPTTQKINGHDAYVIQDVDSSGTGTESFYVDSQGRGHALDFGDSAATYRFTDLTISPARYRLGATTRATSKAGGHASEDGLSMNFTGVASYVTRFVGHELVTTPAGTFLTAKISSTLGGSFSGTITDGTQSLSIKVSLSSALNEYTVPGIGIVKYDSTETSKMTAPAVNESQTTTDNHRVVLIKLPVDSV